MSSRVLIRPEAEADVDEAYLWYLERGEDLGSDFLASLDEAVSGIREHPERYPIVHRDVRRALLRRFPYGLFYLLTSDHRVLSCEP